MSYTLECTSNLRVLTSLGVLTLLTVNSVNTDLDRNSRDRWLGAKHTTRLADKSVVIVLIGRSLLILIKGVHSSTCCADRSGSRRAATPSNTATSEFSAVKTVRDDAASAKNRSAIGPPPLATYVDPHNAFVWTCRDSSLTWATACFPATDDDIRQIEEISLAELRAAGTDGDLVEVARKFGIRRLTVATRARIEQACQLHLFSDA